jgi:outer membrane receptor protein involved in Fe transport
MAPAVPAFTQLQTTRVQGTVVDDGGRPVPGIGVALVDPLGATLRTATTDASGRFLLPDVPPGRFAVRADPIGGAPVHVPLTIEAALPVDVTVRLPPTLTESIRVDSEKVTPSTFSSIAGASLAAVPARVRGRSLQDAVATLPGWATEDNGLLHARGVDDGFLYVIDGVPVYERLDALNGVAPDVPSLASINVVTGYVAPEFGYKAGGVIEVRSTGMRDRWETVGDLGLGSNSSFDGGLVTGGTLRERLDLRVGGSSQRSDRFLDPVHPDNLHNQGSAGTVSGHAGYRGGLADQVRTSFGIGRARYDVPNIDEQDAAGQDQRQRVALGYADLSWQRAWSDSTVSQLAVYHRRSSAALEGSSRDTPIFASSDRSLARTGGIAAISHQRGRHLLKGGIEAQALSLDETFGFFVTDDEEASEAGLSDAALEHDRDNPFSFAGEASPRLWSVYVQDSWQAGAALTVAAGVRFDGGTLLLGRQQWSPRAGVSYRPGSSTVVRGSVSRFFQPPQPEYLLLSSSEEARELSPFATEATAGGSSVEPERQWAFEAGVEHRFRHWRVDAAWWRRDVREAADPNVFFGTTVIFPNAVARGRAHGLDVRLEVPQRRGWSGYASASVGRVVQTGPVTGGLFLEDEVGDIGPGVEFTPDHDQRVVLASGGMWEHARSGLSVSVAARYESGTPLQREDDDEDELAERPGAELADFESGRVKPRTIVSLVASVPLVQADRVRVHLRGAVLNVFDQRYAFNFGNPFSGTHFGAPRTASLSLQVTLR